MSVIAASAFYDSGFENAFIASYDGGGNDGTFCLYEADKNEGLKKLNENPCIGLQALLQSYQIKDEYEVADIVFGIGPKINAAGRIADAKSSVKLLIEEDFHQAMFLAKTLIENNTERKDIDNDITKEALEILERDHVLRHKKSTVLYSEKMA